DTLEAQVQAQGQHIELSGKGKGVLDAFVKGLSAAINHDIVLLDYNEHALPSKLGSENEQAEAMAYVQISIQGQRYCAASHCDDIVTASMQAVLNALSRSDLKIASSAISA
ncbi:MAG: alpha-isopropylmalate synthase regulatory domain-containing protein, partial [Psychromonas sp.]